MAAIYFTEDHEFIEVDDNGVGTVGITSHAQEQLGDVVFVELPDVGAEFDQGDDAGVVESVKAASEIYAPVSGEVVEVNEALVNSPSLVNEDPMGDGWFFKIKLADEDELSGLKDDVEYEEYLEAVA